MLGHQGNEPVRRCDRELTCVILSHGSRSTGIGSVPGTGLNCDLCYGRTFSLATQVRSSSERHQSGKRWLGISRRPRADPLHPGRASLAGRPEWAAAHHRATGRCETPVVRRSPPSLQRLSVVIRLSQPGHSDSQHNPSLCGCSAIVRVSPERGRQTACPSPRTTTLDQHEDASAAGHGDPGSRNPVWPSGSAGPESGTPQSPACSRETHARPGHNRTALHLAVPRQWFASFPGSPTTGNGRPYGE